MSLSCGFMSSILLQSFQDGQATSGHHAAKEVDRPESAFDDERVIFTGLSLESKQKALSYRWNDPSLLVASISSWSSKRNASPATNPRALFGLTPCTREHTSKLTRVTVAACTLPTKLLFPVRPRKQEERVKTVSGLRSPGKKGSDKQLASPALFCMLRRSKGSWLFD